MSQNQSINISDEKVQLLKSGFKQYMNSEYAHLKSKSTIVLRYFRDKGNGFFRF